MKITPTHACRAGYRPAAEAPAAAASAGEATASKHREDGWPDDRAGARLRRWLSALPGAFTLPWLMAAIAFVVVFCSPGFTDPDFYWHLKTGELIAQTGAIPVTDPYSFTYGGQAWVAHEWLTELIFHAIERAGGFDALRGLPALAAAANFLLLYAIARRLTGKESSAALATLLFFIPMVPSFTLRPQIFTYLCFTFFLLALVDVKYLRSTRLLWWLPALMLLWVNLHGAYMLGFALLGVFIATEAGNRWLFPVRQSRGTQRLGLLCGVSLVAVLAALLNPQGVRMLLYPFETVAMEASRGLIAEWHSPDFHDLLPRVSLLGIFAYVLAAIYARRKPDLTEVVLPLLLIVAGLSAWRHLPLMSIVLLTFFCAMLRQLRPSELLLRRWTASRRKSVHAGQQVTRAQAGTIHLLLLVAVVIAAANGALRTEHAGQTSKFVARGAADHVLTHGLSGRLLNDYDLGGYLIYRLWPTHKVFIDGRADLYGDDFLKAYFRLDKGHEGWEKMIDEQGIDIVIYARAAALPQLLLASGRFTQVYGDAHHLVLVRAARAPLPASSSDSSEASSRTSSPAVARDSARSLSAR